MKYVSIREMIAIEKEANERGMTYANMMQHAGEGLAQIIRKRFSEKKELGILGLVGSGNNGGDTLVALNSLAAEGWKTTVYLARPRDSEDALLKKFQELNPHLYSAQNDPELTTLRKLLQEHAILLDGVLGTGIQLPLKGEVARILEFVKQFTSVNSALIVIAVDCPSGVNCDTGAAAQETIPAHLTVTMAAMKQGLLRFPANNLVGEVCVTGIGLPEEGNSLDSWRSISRFVPEEDQIRQWLPARPKDAHKGTFGTSVIVAGSVNYTGAALLAGEAAYRAGTGLVNMAVPGSLQPILAGNLPEAVWTLLPEKQGVISADAVEILLKAVQRASSLLIGPGLGLEATTQEFMRRLLDRDQPSSRGGIGFIPAKAQNADRYDSLPPLTIDADGLKHLARIEGWYKLLPPGTILTPHPGEMAVLTGLETEVIQADRVAIAEQFSRSWRQVVVLKGAFTIIAYPEHSTAIIPVATPALARAGTGDVLAGLITGLRAQGVDSFKAAVCGAWIHAYAGIAAQKKIGNTASVLARDILDGAIHVLSTLSK
jgi:NAD(P)H-hydrate epimerase